MLERSLERYLRQEVKKLGGEVRKVRWIGRRSAPDDLVLLHHVGRSFWIELKKPGEKPTAAQDREHKRLSACEQDILWASSREEIDHILRAYEPLPGF